MEENCWNKRQLIHLYFGVNLDIVWDIVKNKVPVLRDRVSRLLSELEGKI